MPNAVTKGGCLCGAIRYVTHGLPTASMICHCNSCCRAAGSPVVAWLTFPASQFSFVRGSPAAYRSTGPVTRTFCSTCGTSLTYVHAERASEIDVTTSTLDDPEAFPPTYHSWLSDGASWVRFGDGLPAYERSSAEGGALVRETLQAIAVLLERHDASSNALAIALLGDEQKMWDYLVSNELWGGAGSVADQALPETPDARAELERLMIRLGREQMAAGRVNHRTAMWVSAFEKWQAEGFRRRP